MALVGSCGRSSLSQERARLQGLAATRTRPLTQGVVFPAPVETTENLDIQGLPRQKEKADARIRTADPFITSEVLYQLSYVGVPLD